MLAGGLQVQPLPAADELARQADYFADLADERGLRIQCEGDAALQAEPQLLRRALANLLANAIRHAKPGSVIELRARVEPDGDALLEVINEGEPLPPEQLPRLFDRFYRADAARSGEAGGSGLGLAIVQAIMALHGGSARVWQDEGSRIGFALWDPLTEDVRP